MLNKLILMGRLTSDPELRTTTSGTSVVTFTLAVERNYTPQGQEKKTDFVNCVAWKNTAEFISRYFSKGKLMAVESELQSRTYENREGKKVTDWEAVVSQAYFGGDKSSSSSSKPNINVGYDEIVDDDDDLPFA